MDGKADADNCQRPAKPRQQQVHESESDHNAPEPRDQSAMIRSNSAESSADSVSSLTSSTEMVSG